MPWELGRKSWNIKASDVAGDASFFEVFEPQKVMLADDLPHPLDTVFSRSWLGDVQRAVARCAFSRCRR